MPHTPGPWIWDERFTVSIPHAKGWVHFRVEPEDAQLIWAAPELLAALKAMEDTAMRLGLARGDGSDDGPFFDALTAHFAAIEQGLAAIAKAEGR